MAAGSALAAPARPWGSSSASPAVALLVHSPIGVAAAANAMLAAHAEAFTSRFISLSSAGAVRRVFIGIAARPARSVHSDCGCTVVVATDGIGRIGGGVRKDLTKVRLLRDADARLHFFPRRGILLT